MIIKSRAAEEETPAARLEYDRRRRPAREEMRGLLLVRDVVGHGVVDIRDILVLLKLSEELGDARNLVVSQSLGVVGDARELGRHNLEAVVLKIFLNGGKALVFSVDVDLVLLLVKEDLRDAEVDELELKLLEVDALFVLYDEVALVLEHESYAARRAESAPELGEVAADVGDCAVGVVGGSLDEYRNAMGAVALVDHFLVVRLVLAACLFDGALNVLLRHVLCLGVLNDGSELRIGMGIGSAGLDGYDDLFANSSKSPGHIAPSLHLAGLTVFKRSSHISTGFCVC